MPKKYKTSKTAQFINKKHSIKYAISSCELGFSMFPHKNLGQCVISSYEHTWQDFGKKPIWDIKMKGNKSVTYNDSTRIFIIAVANRKKRRRNTK